MVGAIGFLSPSMLSPYTRHADLLNILLLGGCLHLTHLLLYPSAFA